MQRSGLRMIINRLGRAPGFLNLCGLLSVALLPSAARADLEEGITQLFKQIDICTKKAEIHDDMDLLNKCMDPQIQVSDKLLNRAYQATIVRIKAKAESDEDPVVEGKLLTLRKAQRSWIMFRDLNCAAEVANVVGAIPASYMSKLCVARMSLDRARELEGWMATKLK